MKEAEKNSDSVFIVKPCASSQGKGIFLTNKILEVSPIYTETKVQKVILSHVNMLVSQYIINPLTIDGLKFDFRIYVAVSCVNPLRIYRYKEGLAR